MRNCPTSRIEKAFTLIEVLIASGILVFALVSALAVATQGFRYISDMRRTARSSQVLQERMEDIRLITIWTNLLALNGTTFIDTNLPECVFRGSVSTAAYPPYDSYGGSPIVMRVTIAVTWTNRSQKVLTNSLTSLFCRDGLNTYIY